MPDFKDYPKVMPGYPITKRCPCCGKELFSDLDTCYVCGYSFKGIEGKLLRETQQAGADSVGPRQLKPGVVAARTFRPRSAGVGTLDAGIQDTGKQDVAAPDSGTAQIPLNGVHIRLRTASADVLLSVGPRGLTLGSDPSCDVILHGPAVSDLQLFLKPAAAGLHVCDPAATYPGRFRGKSLPEAAIIPFGEALELCGSILEVYR